MQVNQGLGQFPGESYGGYKQSGIGREYSLEGMLEATGISGDSSCTACWTCRYPTRITREAETQWAREREPVPSDNAVRDENEAAVK